MSNGTDRGEDRPVLKVRPSTHVEIKLEAVRRRKTLTDLVEEMWAAYKNASSLAVTTVIVGLPEGEAIDVSRVPAWFIRGITEMYLDPLKNPREQALLTMTEEFIRIRGESA